MTDQKQTPIELKKYKPIQAIKVKRQNYFKSQSHFSPVNQIES